MRQTNIHRGAIGEGKFLAICLELGLNVSLPIRPSPYDFIVDNGQKLIRVQVKSVSRIDTSSRGEKVKCMLTHGSINGKRGYTAEMVDFIVLYVSMLDIWYLLPIKEVEDRLTISLFPTVKGSLSKYEVFRNSWKLLC